MNGTQRTNEQATRWNGAAGRAWVQAQEVTDQVLAPFETPLLEAVEARNPRRVLDVGCGTGSTTVAAGRLIGAGGRCTGIDISAPMLAAARARAERAGVAADFIEADAQQHAFAAGTFDLIVSRFGVMFFDDPVRAFANLHRAATDAATLCCVAWRSAAENAFLTMAERAAAPLLPDLPPRKPGPGQFAFADGAKVAELLAQSGWREVDVRAVDVACSFPTEQLVPYLSRMGPVGMALQDADDETRARVIAAVRPAFEPYVHGAEVRFTGACWVLEARA